MTSPFKKLLGSKREKPAVHAGPGSTAATGSHEHAHEMIAHLQMLIATSADRAIPGYLQGESTPDIVMAVGICDGLLGENGEPSSTYDMVITQAREAFVLEVKRRREN
jgi:hypothetical protein